MFVCVLPDFSGTSVFFWNFGIFGFVGFFFFSIVRVFVVFLSGVSFLFFFCFQVFSHFPVFQFFGVPALSNSRYVLSFLYLFGFELVFPVLRVLQFRLSVFYESSFVLCCGSLSELMKFSVFVLLYIDIRYSALSVVPALGCPFWLSGFLLCWVLVP